MLATRRGARLLGVDSGNAIANGTTGVISTTGACDDGLAANGNNNTLVNTGTVATWACGGYGERTASLTVIAGRPGRLDIPEAGEW